VNRRVNHRDAENTEAKQKEVKSIEKEFRVFARVFFSVISGTLWLIFFLFGSGYAGLGSYQ